jgi:hypothetical protein
MGKRKSSKIVNVIEKILVNKSLKDWIEDMQDNKKNFLKAEKIYYNINNIVENLKLNIDNNLLLTCIQKSNSNNI